MNHFSANEIMDQIHHASNQFTMDVDVQAVEDDIDFDGNESWDEQIESEHAFRMSLQQQQQGTNQVNGGVWMAEPQMVPPQGGGDAWMDEHQMLDPEAGAWMGEPQMMDPQAGAWMG